METRVTALRHPCLLFLPTLEDRFWRKLPSLAPRLGGVILDLEDSIHSSAKAAARDKLVEHLPVLRSIRQSYPDFHVIVRVNNAGTEHFASDAALLQRLIVESAVQGVMYPKVSEAAEVDQLRRSIDVDGLTLFLVIETLAGYREYPQILRRDKGVTWCCVGAEDLCADMNIDRPPVFYDNPLLQRIATDVFLHCKIEGIGCWGNIWPYLHVPELDESFIEECTVDRMVGAVGKLVFHPYQIDPVNAVLDPVAQHDTQRAVLLGRLTALKRRASDRGLTVAIHNGRMIDMPEFVRLQRWLEDLPDDDIRTLIASQMPTLESFRADAEP